jgi:hypothetical protein
VTGGPDFVLWQAIFREVPSLIKYLRS